MSAQQATQQTALSQIVAAAKAPAAAVSPAAVSAVGGDLVTQTIWQMLRIQRDTIFDDTETANTNWGQGSEAMIVASCSYEMTDSVGAAAVQAAGVNV
ncbi:hypothetical protein ACFXPS_38710 [Nocardia sp. NPDC059091]|uniref:hypothetical protein n=1 Tax=unclassified Nocardia TaxID=2637762 RepID=UPI00368EFFEC